MYPSTALIDALLDHFSGETQLPAVEAGGLWVAVYSDVEHTTEMAPRQQTPFGSGQEPIPNSYSLADVDFFGTQTETLTVAAIGLHLSVDGGLALFYRDFPTPLQVEVGSQLSLPAGHLSIQIG